MSKLDDLDAAEKNLKDTITGISSKDTLADAAAKIQQSGMQVESARQQLSSAVQCSQ